jgi:hypothetical protein
MNDLLKRQKDMYQGLWFGTILIIIILHIIWLVPAVGGQMDIKEKIYLTILAIIAIPLAWIFFYHQKKKDAGEIEQKENIPDAAFKAVNFFGGIGYFFSSVRYILLFIVFLVGGIYFLITGEEYWWIGLMLVIIALLLPIAIITFWRFGKEKLKGRYY